MKGDQETESHATRRRIAWRVGLTALLLVGIWVLAWWFDLADELAPENLRAVVRSFGVWGPVLYVGIFIGTLVIQAPGSPLVGVAVYLWGWAPGCAIATLGAILGAHASFLFVRALGGDISGLENPFVDRVLKPLKKRPRRAMMIARTVLMTAPALTTALALSGVRARDHLIATAIGMTPAVAFNASLFAFGLASFGLMPR